MQEISSSTKIKRTLSSRSGAKLVALIAILLRIGMLLTYQPVSYGDTPSYRRASEAVINGFSRYDGTRTPGYPIFMAILGIDERIWMAQLVLGVAITMLIYYIALELTGQPVFAVIASLAHTFNLGQLFFEANLLTETLTTFWIILTLAGSILWLLHPERRSIWLAVGLGLSSSLVFITRPLFIFLPFWILIFLLIEHWNRKTVWHGLAFLLPVLLILGGWVGFIHSRYGDWSLTTMTGYHLVQHTGEYFEFVPDQYAELRDVYLDYRSHRIAEYGTQTNTIWDAIPAMQSASGLNFYDLSRTLTQISLRLIIEHPFLYLKNVTTGWWMFWRAPIYWSPHAINLQLFTVLVEFVINIQHYLLIAINIFFIISSIITVALHRRLILSTNKRHFVGLWLGSIWITSIFQTLLDHGDNPRFLVPLQSMVVLWVLWFFWASLQHQSIIQITQSHRYLVPHQSQEISKG